MGQIVIKRKNSEDRTIEIYDSIDKGQVNFLVFCFVFGKWGNWGENCEE